MSSVLVVNETISFPKNTFTEKVTFLAGVQVQMQCSHVDEASYTMGVLTSYTLYAKWE